MRIWKLVLMGLICWVSLGMAQEALPDDKAADWIVWLDGTTYVPEWKTALQAAGTAMEPGEVCDLFISGTRQRFVRSAGEFSVNELESRIVEAVENGGHILEQIRKEMQRNSSSSGDMAIRSYLNARKQLLDLYGQRQQAFWKMLEEGGIAPGSRLLVLVQQFDAPGCSRSMMDNAGDWSMELQDCSPWEEKKKNIKKIAEKLKQQNCRVDGFYLKTRGRTNRADFEVSKALFSGVSRLSKATGGISENLDSDVDVIASKLK